MRAEFLNAYPSAQTRFAPPEGHEEPHPRAVEMAERMREARAAFGSATFADLVQAGFTTAEICEFEVAARKLADNAYVRRIDMPGDRIHDVIEKALAGAAHLMPRLAGCDPAEKAELVWLRYCAARAAWKIDPWPSQQERCLHLLAEFLACFGPLLPRERNRVLYAVAASMKIEKTRGLL